MKLLFNAILALSAVSASAQKKLKMEILDSGDTAWSTGETKIYNSPGSKNAAGEYLKISLYKTGSRLMLVLSIQTGRTSMFNIERGATAEITLASQSSFTISSLRDQTAKRLVSYHGCFIYAFYQLGADEIREIRSSDLSNISVNTTAGKMIFPVKSKDGDSLRKLLEKFD